MGLCKPHASSKHRTFLATRLCENFQKISLSADFNFSSDQTLDFVKCERSRMSLFKVLGTCIRETRLEGRRDSALTPTKLPAVAQQPNLTRYLHTCVYLRHMLYANNNTSIRPTMPERPNLGKRPSSSDRGVSPPPAKRKQQSTTTSKYYRTQHSAYIQ